MSYQTTISPIGFERTYHYLLISLGFAIPTSIALTNLSMYSIFLLWLFSGSYKNKLENLRKTNNKVVMALLLFLAIYLAGITWSENITEGLTMIRKFAPYLLLPIIISIIQKRYIKAYITSFVVAMIISVIVSYLMWLGIIPLFEKATIESPTAFVTRITYNPMLAFAIYLILYVLLFEKLSLINKYILSFLAIIMSINMFITGGRAGQVMFFAMLVIIIFQFNKKILKSIIISSVVIPLIFTLAYIKIEPFKDRVNFAINDIKSFENNRNTSVGLRMTFAQHSFEIFKNNPIIGVGTGSFSMNYTEINAKKTPNLPTTGNPHNMYFFVATELGIIGLMAMLYIFYSQIKFASKSNIRFLKYTGIALPLLFLLIMLSDSYLYLNHAKTMFIFFSAIIYNNYLPFARE